jgi:CheY-like chemotaxis protein
MARILHVDGEHEWRELVRRGLPDHHVDVAGSYDEALELLQSRAPYDLALVDLQLVSDHELLGGELLELLRSAYPDTRPIVIAASPPSGSVRATIVEKYGVEEMLIQSEMAVPDLRYVVDAALGQTVPVDAPLRRAELRRRLQEWRRRQGARLDSRVFAAEMFARNAGKVSGDSRRRVQAALDEAEALRRRFHADADDLSDRIDRAVTIQQVLDAADAVEQVEGVYADLDGR